jgi:hypothetical protein
MSDTKTETQVSYVDPTEDVRRWLRAILVDMLDHPSEHSNGALKVAIAALTDIAEPTLIHDVFGSWVDIYIALMEEYQNKKSTDDQDKLPVDQKESLEES